MNAEKLQEFIKVHKGYDDMQALKASYQVNLFLHSLLYTMLIGILFGLLGYIREYFAIFIFLKVFRTTAGGIHIKGHIKCFITSVGAILWVLSMNSFVTLNIILEILILCYVFILWYLLVPQGTSQRPIRRKEEKQIRKLKMFIFILLTIVVRFIDINIYTLGLWSLVLVLTLLTPIVYTLFRVKHDRV